MLKNYFLVAIRQLFKQQAFSIIHIIGLTIGIAVFLLISLYVVDEYSYDRFHEKGERIYRINQTFIWRDDDALFGSTGPAVKYAIKAEVPEFEDLTRVYTPGAMLVSLNNEKFNKIFEEEGILAVDSNFLQIFTFPLIRGDFNTALSKPYSIVITEEMANKYFDSEDVIGKLLQIGEGAEKQSYSITGVAKNTPSNSHIQFDFLVSMTSFSIVQKRHDSWMRTTFVTFGLTRPDVDQEVLAKKVAQVPGKYLETFLQKYRGISYREFLESGEEWDLYIQPLYDIHLKPTKIYSRLNDTADIGNLYITASIGLLILLISIINYINLATAKSSTRAKEVGIRKTVGSTKSMLVRQFLVESLLYVIIATIGAIIIIDLVLPEVNLFLEKKLSIQSLFQPIAIIGILFIMGIITLTSGLYPAFVLSRFVPVEVLKSSRSSHLGGNNIRSILTGFQFTISVGMIAITLIISRQISTILNFDLGFDKENKILVENVHRLDNNREPFQNEILKNPAIEAVSFSSDTPPLIFDFDNFTSYKNSSLSIPVNYLVIDEYFIDSYGLKLIAGRNFSKGFNDSLQIIVTETFLKSFEFEDAESAIGGKVKYGDTEFRIIGVTNEILANLSDQSHPTAFLDEKAPIFRNPNPQFTVKTRGSLSAEELNALLSDLENSWKRFSSDTPFTYSFIDKDFENIFSSTLQFQKIVQKTTFLLILITCLGMIGMVTFLIEKKNKEIGIRKVLGASISDILFLIFRRFAILLTVALFIATPLCWLLMRGWIENFAVQSRITVDIFILSGAMMLILTVGTIGVQTIKAALVNPIKFIKEE